MTSSYRLNDAPVTAAPPPVPPHTTLTGKYIALLPLEEANSFEELYAASHGDAANEAIWTYMPYGPFASAQQMQACYAQLAAEGAVQFYAVRHLSSGALAGVVSYLRIAPAAYSIEIGHIWHALAQQRGRANTEAAYLLMGNAFDLGYRRVEWKCNALNERSRAAALRLGFAYEGIFRQQAVFKGKNRDTAWYAMIDKDWHAAQQNFLTWRDAEAGAVQLGALNLPLVT